MWWWRDVVYFKVGDHIPTHVMVWLDHVEISGDTSTISFSMPLYDIDTIIFAGMVVMPS